jgi:hypothetical protein
MRLAVGACYADRWGADALPTHARRGRDRSSAQRAAWETAHAGSFARRAVNLGGVGTVCAPSPEGSAAHTEAEFKHL